MIEREQEPQKESCQQLRANCEEELRTLESEGRIGKEHSSTMRSVELAKKIREIEFYGEEVLVAEFAEKQIRGKVAELPEGTNLSSSTSDDSVIALQLSLIALRHFPERAASLIEEFKDVLYSGSFALGCLRANPFATDFIEKVLREDEEDTEFEKEEIAECLAGSSAGSQFARRLLSDEELMGEFLPSVHVLLIAALPPGVERQQLCLEFIERDSQGANKLGFDTLLAAALEPQLKEAQDIFRRALSEVSYNEWLVEIALQHINLDDSDSLFDLLYPLAHESEHFWLNDRVREVIQGNEGLLNIALNKFNERPCVELAWVIGTTDRRAKDFMLFSLNNWGADKQTKLRAAILNPEHSSSEQIIRDSAESSVFPIYNEAIHNCPNEPQFNNYLMLHAEGKLGSQASAELALESLLKRGALTEKLALSNKSPMVGRKIAEKISSLLMKNPANDSWVQAQLQSGDPEQAHGTLLALSKDKAATMRIFKGMMD